MARRHQLDATHPNPSPSQATNCPPHNLGEVVDALSALLDDPDLPDDELFRLLPAPDFPTGGEILGLKPEPQP